MSDEKQTSEKIFDPTMCFMVFGSWVETIANLETDSDRASPAYMLFKCIANYSMFGDEPDPDTVPQLIQVFWPMLSEQIDLSKNNRRRRFASEGPTPKQMAIVEILNSNPGISYRKAAKLSNTSKSAVGNVVKRFPELLSNPVESYPSGSVGSYPDTDNDCPNSPYNSTGTGQNGTPVDTSGQSIEGALTGEEQKEFSLLDRIQARIANTDWEQLEILQNKIDMSRGLPEDKANNYKVNRAQHKWKVAYMAWRQSIANENIVLILEKYLSTHAETATEKMWGDRYGRIIGGWDAEKQEPIIVYSATGEFPQGTRHNVASIPVAYYKTEKATADAEEEMDWFDSLSDQDKVLLENKDTLPF